MNKIKLIALDLDGTALTPQNKVAESTTAAVRRARAAGVYVVVSTGRICGEARDFAIDLDADDLMVTSGGATLSSISGEGCTMRMSMPWEAAVRAAAAVERIGMIAMIYVGETLLITPYDDLGFGSYKTNEGYLTSKKVVPSVAEYIADHHLSVDKIFVRSQDPVTLLRTRAIENGCYVLAANQCGQKARFEAYGHSMIIAPDGEILAEADDTPQVLIAELDPEVLERTRNEIPSLENRRDDLYRVSSGNVRIYEE